MSGLSKILVLGHDHDSASEPVLQRLDAEFEIVRPDSLETGLKQIEVKDFSGIFLFDGNPTTACVLLQAGGLLEQIPDAVVLLNPELEILWSNTRLLQLTGRDQLEPSQSFYSVFGTPEIIGPDFCPFNTALGSGEIAKSTLRVGEKSYFEVHVTPVFETDDEIPSLLVVLVSDVSIEVLQRQKLSAIYQAGLELGDLLPEELVDMSVEERVELLKSKILHFTQDLLEFDTVEIRLVDKLTKRLDPLLVVGMEPVAAGRELYAEPQANGVTGFVAATGKSYLCEDTTNDPLYLVGAADARSSLTVPLMLHDEILGTFNVESPRPGAFNEHDLQFLELFSREIAVALNTLELLAVEKLSSATENTEMILREVAKPVDEILNDAAWILERYIGHEPAVCERLQNVLKHTREIKQLIQKVGEQISPNVSRLQLPQRPVRPKLVDKRILVVDGDDSVRQAAHELLGRFGCEVETAHHGDEALLMVRRFDYDAVLVDIRLPDMTGYDCFSQLRAIREDVAVILMTGFGYDPSHSIVKARQEGVTSVLYKPFRVDQLVSEVEKSVSAADVAKSANT